MLQEQSCRVLPESLLEVSDLYTMCGYWLTVPLPWVWHLLGKSWCSQYRGALGYILWDPFALLSLSRLLCSSFPSASSPNPLPSARSPSFLRDVVVLLSISTCLTISCIREFGPLSDYPAAFSKPLEHITERS